MRDENRVTRANQSCKWCSCWERCLSSWFNVSYLFRSNTKSVSCPFKLFCNILFFFLHKLSVFGRFCYGSKIIYHLTHLLFWASCPLLCPLFQCHPSSSCFLAIRLHYFHAFFCYSFSIYLPHHLSESWLMVCLGEADGWWVRDWPCQPLTLGPIQARKMIDVKSNFKHPQFNSGRQTESGG